MGRPVHTFSIVARDPDSGELGVAMQSHWFSVGPLVGADAHPEVRQVAMVDAHGNTAVHTGARAIQAAGHRTGPGYSVQSNMMLNETVPAAMARAYERTDGDLTARLMAALEAAQAEGGDIRGKQSAAILVVTGERVANPWEGRIVDLRVEDHPEPVQELRRLVHLNRAYAHMNAGDEALTEGGWPPSSSSGPDIVTSVFGRQLTSSIAGIQIERPSERPRCQG